MHNYQFNFNRSRPKMSSLVTSIRQKMILRGILLREAIFWNISLLSTDSNRVVSYFPLNTILLVLLSIERPLFNIKRVSSIFDAKFVSMSWQ